MKKRKPELDFAALKVLRRRHGRNGPMLRLLEQLDANQRYRRHPTPKPVNRYYAPNADRNHRHKAAIPCTRKCPQWKQS